MTVWICRTCAVEHADTDSPPEICEICDDERQWVPATGQVWTTLEELQELGHLVAMHEVEPGLLGLVTEPHVGIGQQTLLACTPEGNVLWDPLGFLDEETVRKVRREGDVVAIAASHPHMFGAQVEWSRALGNVPVLVNQADARWLAREDDVVRYWSGQVAPVPGFVIHQIGGHFPGNAVATWTGADGLGVLLCGDTIGPNPDQQTVAFMRSYPNRIPLSGAVAQRVARDILELDFDRIYGNFGNVIPRDSKNAVRYSADRHAAWVRGDHDHLT